MYNYLKVKDVRASQLPVESLPERAVKVKPINNFLSIYLYCSPLISYWYGTFHIISFLVGKKFVPVAML